MADHHASAEPDEQIDLDGDNDIEDMMDDEDAVDEDRYRKARDEYPEDDSYRDVRNEYADDDSCRMVKDDYTEDGSYSKMRDEFVDDDNYRKVRDEYADDDNYRKVRDEYAEDESYRKVRGEYAEGNNYRKARDDYTEQPGSEGEGVTNKVAASDEANKTLSSLTDGENPVGSKNEDDSEKRAELLALPPHGSEVFIGGLPRDVTEEHLRELCEPFGEIFEVRLMKDKDTKENKGFAFVTFTSKDAAQRAIEDIQDKEFKGRTLRCSLSQVKHRLFIGNVPKGLTEEELKNILENSGPGVENIECFKDPQNPNRNRGFLFVEYYNHECAEYARQRMTSSNFKLDGSTPTVSWADPKNSADSSSAASQVKAIYVKNLPENVTSEKLKELFECHGEITKVVLPPAKAGQKRDFGFIHFAERSSALKAVKGAEKYEIDGHVVEATLAKPQTDRNHASNSQKPGLLPSYPTYPHSYSGDPYGAYGAGYGGQPMIYGRGPMPPGMRMVPMVLPDGRIGYVLQQPGAQAPPPPPPRRSDRSGGHSDSRSRGSDGDRGRRYRPY